MNFKHRSAHADRFATLVMGKPNTWLAFARMPGCALPKYCNGTHAPGGAVTRVPSPSVAATAVLVLVRVLVLVVVADSVVVVVAVPVSVVVVVVVVAESAQHRIEAASALESTHFTVLGPINNPFELATT